MTERHNESLYPLSLSQVAAGNGTRARLMGGLRKLPWTDPFNVGAQERDEPVVIVAQLEVVKRVVLTAGRYCCRVCDKPYAALTHKEMAHIMCELPGDHFVFPEGTAETRFAKDSYPVKGWTGTVCDECASELAHQEVALRAKRKASP